MLPEDSDPFFHEVQEDYLAVAPEEFRDGPPRPEKVSDLTAEMEASGHFAGAVASRHFWEVDYGPDDYIAVIDTYSPMRSLDPEKRQRLHDRIHRRIESKPGRTVTKTYLATLSIARRT